MTGRRFSAAATAGGWSGCGARLTSSISPGSTTSGAWWPTGRCPPASAPPATGAGSGARDGRSFGALESGLGGRLPLVAEDLGVITEPVERLRREVGLPGMLVLQFGMDPDDPSSPHRLANHTADRIVYTATHDQDTVCGWLGPSGRRQRAFVDGQVAAAGFADPRRPWWGLIQLAFSSPAVIAMTQAQDLLGWAARRA